MRFPVSVFASTLLMGSAALLTAPLLAQSITTTPGSTIQLAKPANGSKTDVEVNQEFANADNLLQKSQWQQAEDLFRDCISQRPMNGRYAEELANALIGRAGVSEPATQKQLNAEARTWYRKAAQLGDTSGHVQIMLEMFDNADKAPAVAQREPTPAEKTLMEAEDKFKHGDLDGAMPIYDKAITEDPKLYEAPLYAGDAAYKLKRFNDAGKYYAMAVAINPNRETAYRYWGDALVASGNANPAEDKYLEAIIAEPYGKASWAGLQQWAQVSKRRLGSPAIKVPNGPSVDANKPGNINIMISPRKDGDPNATIWMTYQLMRGGQMIKDEKTGKPARHSLEDEASSLRLVVSTAKEQKIPDNKLDPSIALLRKLDADGMLECWILLNHADQGIAQDYVAYRSAHRPLLHAYLAKYVVLD